ncbi:2961_t:CDS:1, partial [Gigaspora margarita]
DYLINYIQLAKIENITCYVKDTQSEIKHQQNSLGFSSSCDRIGIEKISSIITD